MRIAYFVDIFPLISETFVLEQVTGMIDRGHDVTIFANTLRTPDVCHPAVDEYRLFDRTVVLPSVSRGLLRRLRQVVESVAKLWQSKSLRRGSVTLNPVRFGRQALGMSLLVRAAPHYGHKPFDIIHCQFGQLAPPVATLRRCGALDGALVTSFRGADAARHASSNPSAFAELFRVGDAFLAVSDSVRRRLIELGCPDERIRLLRSGINLRRYEFRGFRPPGDPLRIITVARLTPKKGIAFGLDAVRRLKDRGRRIHYRIIGDGPLRGELRQYASDLGLDDVVTFEGAVDSSGVIRILRDSDLMILPSVRGPGGDEEGVPNSLKEAMAIGLPCIGTDSGGTPELLRDEQNGFVVPQRDAAAIASRIEQSIDGWSELEPIVQNARGSIEDEYDIVRLNDALEASYRELAGNA